MSRISRQKQKANIANPDINSGILKSAAILTVGTDGKINLSNSSASSFELNPNTWEENKVGGWIPQQVPGQSDPIYQWVSGGARTVTFQALVTKDTIHFGQNESNPLDSLISTGLNVVGNIASQFAGVALPPIADMFDDPSAGGKGTSLSITNKLAYYRTLMYPQYTKGHKSLSNSPPLVVLVTGALFSEATASPDILAGATPNAHYLPVWVVTNLNIRITKQLPNLDPMEAVVSFTLAEYTINPISQDNHLITVAPATPSVSDIGGFLS